jgi:hypothetical protein
VDEYWLYPRGKAEAGTGPFTVISVLRVMARDGYALVNDANFSRHKVIWSPWPSGITSVDFIRQKLTARCVPVIAGKFSNRLDANGVLQRADVNFVPHAMSICGDLPSRQQVIARNMYGPGWGVGGCCFIPYDLLAPGGDWSASASVDQLIEDGVIQQPGSHAVTEDEIVAALAAHTWSQTQADRFRAATVITATAPPSGASAYVVAGEAPLTDYRGDKWSLLAGGQIIRNGGYSSGIAWKLALDSSRHIFAGTNNVKDVSGIWYKWDGSAWQPSAAPA